MRKFSELTSPARAYVATVVAVGLTVVLHSIFVLFTKPIAPEWLILGALTLLTGSFTIKVPSTTARLTVSETFVFASVLLFGVAAGTLTVALETLVVALWTRRDRRSEYRWLFNLTAAATSIWVSATAFFAFSGTGPFLNRETPLTLLFAPLAVLTIIYFVLNSSLVAIAVGLERNESPAHIWWKNFTWLSINYFSGASVAAVIVTYTNTLNTKALFGTLIIILPLLLISYLTFRTAMGRVEDASQHLDQLNRLYLSTIETLAMAIDAKDQVTHGHIRRVQIHATSLARHVGVRDEKLLKAIEAAALLHDMGKLAVPEYILNKPGKLTEAEFEKMKLHASVGADILSAIDFPYPVVPIVRHHHENWDGTGYPAGIKGTDIPIGARILAVVDCFDALTSDRPYRPRLSDPEAIAILMDRRGSMYDPLIVDTFARVHAMAPKEVIRNGPPSEVLNTIAHSRRTSNAEQESATLDEIMASADEMLSVYELAQSLAGHVSISDAGDVIAKHLRRLIPSSLCVFFLYDRAADELEARHVVGDGTSLIRGIRIALGQRLSGWVAANRQTISNSDASLDLGDAARSTALRLRSCISTPLVWRDNLVGVLSFYSTKSNAFNDDHRRIIEVVARQIVHTFARAIEFDNSSRRDSLTGLPPVEQLEKVLQSAVHSGIGENSRHALLFVEVADLKAINVTHGRGAGDEVLRHVVRHARAGLRVADILFRNTGDDFVALLSATDGETAELVAERVRHRISTNPVLLGAGVSLTVQANVIAVAGPRDGNSMKDLLSVARQRRGDRHGQQPGAIVH